MLSKKLNRIRLHHFMTRFFSRQRPDSNDWPSNVTSAISSEYGDDLISKDYSRRLPLSFVRDSARTLRNKLQRAKQKLKAITLLRLMYRDVVLYGTSSGLLDDMSCYKPCLPRLLQARQVGFSDPPPPTSRCCPPFNPEAPFKKLWNALVLTFLVLTIVYVPVEIAFFHSNSDVSVGAAMTVIDYIFLTDVLVTLNTSFYQEGTLVLSRRSIAVHYLHGTLIIDVLSSLPMDLFSLGVKSQALLRYFRIFRLVKLFRAARFHGTISYLMKANAQSQQRVAAAMSRIMGAMVLLLLLTHFTACMWYFAATYDEDVSKSWVTAFKFQDLPLGELYLKSLYWSITVLATVGYGDIYAISVYEKMLACMWMLVGAMFFSFFLSTMSSVLTGLDLKGGLIRDKLELLKVYCHNLHLTRNFRSAMATQLLRSMRNNTLDQNQKLDLAMMLPKDLRVEVASRIFKSAALRVAFFTSQDPIFLANIVNMLEYRQYDTHNVVYSRGAYADEVYFMGRGRVSFVVGGNKVPFRTLISGSFFGETEVIEEKPREYTAITMAETEVFVLTRRILAVVADEFPLVFQQLTKIARKRKELCLHSLIQSSYIMEQIEMGDKNQCLVTVDKELLRHQFRTEMKKLDSELRTQEVSAKTLREELLELAAQVEGLKRSVKAAASIWKTIPRKLPVRAPRPR